MRRLGRSSGTCRSADHHATKRATSPCHRWVISRAVLTPEGLRSCNDTSRFNKQVPEHRQEKVRALVPEAGIDPARPL